MGWKYWRDKLGTGGVTVPEDKWYDSEFLVRASINLPMVFGFRKGKPRRAAPLMRLMETTTAAVDYSDEAGMSLDKICRTPHPTLVVYGEDSVFMDTYEYLRKNLPNCTALLMPDSEHFGPLEQPEFLMEHMREFLAGD
jgi:pimeloyl-ACP methyl ester carboxylesterase